MSNLTSLKVDELDKKSRQEVQAFLQEQQTNAQVTAQPPLLL
jgi:hypothetical protein